jgi:hypothetical protein
MRNPHRKETTLGTYLSVKSKVAKIRQTPSVLLALFLFVSSLHFLDVRADGCLPGSIEEPAAHNHGHEDPGEDHFFLIEKHSSDDILSDREFPGGQILCLPSFAFPPQLPPPKS